MDSLFEPLEVGKIRIKNRFMRSATTSAYAQKDGTVRQPIVDLYRDLARGEVGLIVTGHLYVQRSGKAHQGMAGISDDKHIPGLRCIAEAVHEHGGSVVAQLNHAGIQHKPNRIGPSEYIGEGWRSRAMSEDEIQSIITAFGDAAQRAMSAGFDGVQVHAAHGYLISQFLSRLVNRRSDKWGGSLRSRMALLEAVYDEIRYNVGSTPVLLKLNCDDFSPNGFTIEDSIVAAQRMLEKGIDLLEISGGGVGRQEKLKSRANHGDPALRDLPFAGHAARIRAKTKPSLMALVNGFKSLETMTYVIESDLCDMVSMSRPFIRNPSLIRDLRKGLTSASCIRCNRCLGPEVFGKEMLKCHID